MGECGGEVKSSEMAGSGAGEGWKGKEKLPLIRNHNSSGCFENVTNFKQVTFFI